MHCLKSLKSNFEVFDGLVGVGEVFVVGTGDLDLPDVGVEHCLVVGDEFDEERVQLQAAAEVGDETASVWRGVGGVEHGHRARLLLAPRVQVVQRLQRTLVAQLYRSLVVVLEEVVAWSERENE